jgi:Tol biopolymer transport system component
MRFILFSVSLTLLLFISIFGAMGVGAAFPGDEVLLDGVYIRRINVHTSINQVLHPIKWGQRPVWSSDGKQIAFEQFGSDDLQHIYVANAVGSDAWFLGYGYGPVWSPRGRQIAFTHNTTVYIVDLVSNTSTHFTRNTGVYSGLAWSPEGSWLAYNDIDTAGDSSIYLMELGTGERYWLAKGFYARWSPDGRTILYTDSESRIMIISAEGGGVPSYIIYGYNPEWSPNSTHFAYTAFPSNNRVMTYSVEDRTPSFVANGLAPIIWSSDGESLAFWKGDWGHADLVLHHLDSGHEYVLGRSGGGNFGISWRP